MKKLKEETLKVIPVISSAKKFTVEGFQGFSSRKETMVLHGNTRL